MSVLVPAVGAVGVPVSAGEAFVANGVISAAISAPTNAVVASCVVLVLTEAVGAVGVPLSAGEAKFALVAVLALT